MPSESERSTIQNNPLITIKNNIQLPSLPNNLVVSWKVEGDGNCLPRAICLTLYGSQDGHANLRRRAVEYIRQNPQYFMQDIEISTVENINDYCTRMAKLRKFGDAIFLMACCYILKIDIKLFTVQSHIIIESVKANTKRTGTE